MHKAAALSPDNTASKLGEVILKYSEWLDYVIIDVYIHNLVNTIQSKIYRQDVHGWD